MWEERARLVRRDIAGMAGAGLAVADLHAAAMALVARYVGSELTCWATLDPESVAISAMISGDVTIPPEYEPLLAGAEYSRDEPHGFAELAARIVPIAQTSDLSEARRRRSLRLNTVWRPLGLDQELRVVFTADGAPWGAAGLVRAGRDFTGREREFLLAVAPAVAAATRLAVRSTPSGGAPGHPAVVVVGQQGELRAATPAAREWQARLDDAAPGRFAVILQVMAAGARSDRSGSFRARLQDRHGGWAVLHASPLIGTGEDQIAVAIEPATGDQLASLLLAAYGLSPREREVAREVIDGHPTAAIAQRLGITANTVQDHLKSLFAKVDVRSRGELVARLRPDLTAERRAFGAATGSAIGAG